MLVGRGTSTFGQSNRAAPVPTGGLWIRGKWWGPLCPPPLPLKRESGGDLYVPVVGTFMSRPPPPISPLKQPLPQTNRSRRSIQTGGLWGCGKPQTPPDKRDAQGGETSASLRLSPATPSRLRYGLRPSFPSSAEARAQPDPRRSSLSDGLSASSLPPPLHHRPPLSLQGLLGKRG